MGVDRCVPCIGSTPKWSALHDRLVPHGPQCKLQMINGELAFPDETPPDDWRELRLGTPSGMVTLRREDELIRLIVWGNADAALLHERDQIAEAIIGMLKDAPA